MRGKRDTRPVIERLMESVVPQDNGCWLRLTDLDGAGYGRITVDGRRENAHAVSYRLFVGAVPDGLELDHLCRVRQCINPDHLEPVTHRENLLRGESPAALSARRECCVHGHPYDPENTLIRSDGSRMCRKCKLVGDRERQRRYQARKAAAR